MSVKSFAPQNMAELFSDLAKMTPESKIIAGGTDLNIRLHGGSVKTDALLYVGGISEMRQIVKTEDKVEIGAAATMSEIAKNPLLQRGLAAIADAAGDVGSTQIRNNATIGGNVANASPAGDIIVPLFMLKAEAVIANSKGQLRCVPISEVVLGPSKNSLGYDEAIVKFVLPLPLPGRRSAFVKLGFRKAVNIARIGLAASLEVAEDGLIKAAEMMVGAISLVPLHMEAAEQYMLGKRPDEAVETVGQMLSDLIMEKTPKEFDRDYKVGAARGAVDDLLRRFC
ncbi:FAD binding domain-containing protein [Dehalobacterium formicoaceticum]|uniref:FAD binding domain-containing protein n=1 Tax=Dehalobacterium formicoaceticum TaxID=51515 RepID=UPI000B7EC7EC|nr:FAD binding domain-containing protein [Dehalobacterium formicoaceticum]